MEQPQHSLSTIDSSRPFGSVKEAVAMFGEKFLAGEIYFSSSPKPSMSPNKTSPTWKKISPSPKKFENDQITVVDTLKRLEAELEDTKAELKLLKERERETEVAVASLNAELHKNMSKIARVEAAAAAVAVEGLREEERRRDVVARVEEPSTLAEILSPSFFGERKNERKKMKKKPIVPLVGDLFGRRKGSSTTSSSLHNSLFSSTHVYLN